MALVGTRLAGFSARTGFVIAVWCGNYDSERGGVGVGLIVAFAAWPRGLASDLDLGSGEQGFGSFIKISTNGRVTVAVPQVETGQGIWTALPQVVAEHPFNLSFIQHAGMHALFRPMQLLQLRR